MEENKSCLGRLVFVGLVKKSFCIALRKSPIRPHGFNFGLHTSRKT